MFCLLCSVLFAVDLALAVAASQESQPGQCLPDALCQFNFTSDDDVTYPYDLSPLCLEGSSYTADDGMGHTYEFNICGNRYGLPPRLQVVMRPVCIVTACRRVGRWVSWLSVRVLSPHPYVLLHDSVKQCTPNWGPMNFEAGVAIQFWGDAPACNTTAPMYVDFYGLPACATGAYLTPILLMWLTRGCDRLLDAAHRMPTGITRLRPQATAVDGCA